VRRPNKVNTHSSHADRAGHYVVRSRLALVLDQNIFL